MLIEQKMIQYTFVGIKIIFSNIFFQSSLKQFIDPHVRFKNGRIQFSQSIWFITNLDGNGRLVRVSLKKGGNGVEYWCCVGSWLCVYCQFLTSSYFYNQLSFLISLYNPKFNMEHDTNIFIHTISCLKNKTNISDLVNDFKDQLKVKNLKRTALRPENIIKKFNTLKRKYSKGTLAITPFGWHQNQRKLFLWFFLTYSHLHFKKTSEITTRQWKEFSECFHHKNPLLLRYEAVSLQRNSQRVHWSSNEQNLLKNCINSSLNGKWSEISRNLFYQSQGEFFKTAKQCRQHWFNHMNTDIKKGGWSIEQDLMILNFVLEQGRHWSRLIQQQGRIRTEHMVKNRYSTLINLGKKYCNIAFEVNNNNDQNILITSIITYLNTHKQLFYQIQASSSSPELQPKSEKSISLEHGIELKEEFIEPEEEGNKKITTRAQISIQKIQSISIENHIAEIRPQQPNQQIDINSNNTIPLMTFPLVPPYPFPYQPNNFYVINNQINLLPFFPPTPPPNPPQNNPNQDQEQL